MSTEKTTAVTTAYTEEIIATSLNQKYAAAQEYLANTVRRFIDFGATLAAAESELLKQGKLNNRKQGEGMFAWLAEHCPDINYKTAMRYKKLATDCCAGLGVGFDDGLKMLQGRDDETACKKIPKAAIKRRDEIFEAGSVRKLSQMLFNFGEDDGAKRGRPEGSKADLSRKPDTNDAALAARAVWSKVIAPAVKCMPALATAVNLLCEADVDDAITAIESMAAILRERKAELQANAR